jgi:hypothetical protein
MIANMIIVGLSAFNEEKRADRLLENEFVIYQGRIGIVKSVEPVNNALPEGGDVTVRIDVTFKSGKDSPVATTDTMKITVPRKAIFNTVQVMVQK